MTKKAPNATDVHIGQKIRARRMVLAMSQNTLAVRLGLTFQQVPTDIGLNKGRCGVWLPPLPMSSARRMRQPTQSARWRGSAMNDRLH